MIIQIVARWISFLEPSVRSHPHSFLHRLNIFILALYNDVTRGNIGLKYFL